MRPPWWQVLPALALLGWNGQAGAGGVQATLGLEYDDNPFEASESRRAGWVSRLYLSSNSRLLEGEWGRLHLGHEWGVKRFWRSEERRGARGDVVANHLELGGFLRLRERFLLNWGTELKFKNAQRVSSEESYVRGGLDLSFSGQLSRALRASLSYRRGGDDVRDMRLADLSLHQLGCDLEFRRGRSLRLQTGLAWRWLEFARPALRRDGEGQWSETGGDQEDRTFEWRAGFQYYRSILVQAGYALLDNRSNSLGYGFRAHRLQFMLSRYLALGVDGQLFLTAQRRRYDEHLPGPLPGMGSEQDEYAQTVVACEFSRRLGTGYGLSWQYRHARNGSGSGGAFYRKNIYSLSLDFSL